METPQIASNNYMHTEHVVVTRFHWPTRSTHWKDNLPISYWSWFCCDL